MITEAEIAAVVLGLSEIIKNLGFPKKYTPVFAILLAISLTIFQELREGGVDFLMAGIRGVIIGATTTGIYAAASHLLGKNKNGKIAVPETIQRKFPETKTATTEKTTTAKAKPATTKKAAAKKTTTKKATPKKTTAKTTAAPQEVEKK